MPVAVMIAIRLNYILFHKTFLSNEIPVNLISNNGKSQKKNSLFLFLKWCVAQQDFSQLLTNKSVRATYTDVIYNRMNIICIHKTRKNILSH